MTVASPESPSTSIVTTLAVVTPRESRSSYHNHVTTGAGPYPQLRGRPSQNTNMPKNAAARAMVHQVAKIKSICQATSRRTTALRTAFLISSPGRKRCRALSHGHTRSWRARGRRSPSSVVACGGGWERSYTLLSDRWSSGVVS